VYWTGRAAPTFDAMIMLALMTAACGGYSWRKRGVVAGPGAALAFGSALYARKRRSGTSLGLRIPSWLLVTWLPLRYER
jgi:hypothetical protein